MNFPGAIRLRRISRPEGNTDQKKGKNRDQIHDADPLMVGREYPGEDTAVFPFCVIEAGRCGCVVSGRGHLFPPFLRAIRKTVKEETDRKNTAANDRARLKTYLFSSGS